MVVLFVIKFVITIQNSLLFSAWSGVEEGSKMVGSFPVYAKQGTVMGSTPPCAERPFIYHAKKIDYATGGHLLTSKFVCTHREVCKIGKIGLATWHVLRTSTSAICSESNTIVCSLHAYRPPFSR